MLRSLWRRLWHGTSGPSRGPHLAYRPQIEPLEGRQLPAFWGSALFALAPALDAVGMPQQSGSPFAGGVTALRVTVRQNASETVIDLGPVFAAMRGLQHKAGLQLTILGNTN